MNIVIVGCGNLGSNIARCLYTLDNDVRKFDLNRLTLYDSDMLEEKNLPYLTVEDSNLVGVPKVFILKDLMESSFENVNICAYDKAYTNDYGKYHLDSHIIDCRDTGNKLDAFMKVTTDYNIGCIEFNTEYEEKNINGLYYFGKSSYYTNLFAYIAVDRLVNYDKSNDFKRREIILLDKLSESVQMTMGDN